MSRLCFENRSHLIEELFAVSSRKTLKTFIENLNEDLDEEGHIDPDISIREITRALMFVPLEILENNFYSTFDEVEVEDEDEDEDDSLDDLNE